MTAEKAEKNLEEEFSAFAAYYFKNWRLHELSFPVRFAAHTNLDTANVDDLCVLSDRVAALNLFSDNEVIDDVPTSSIKYLLLPLIFAQAIEADSDYSRRETSLSKARKFYQIFMSTTLSLLESEPDYKALTKLVEPAEGREPASSGRERAIERRHKSQDLESTIVASRGLHFVQGGNEDEEMCRVGWVAFLKWLLVESAVSLELLNKELKIREGRQEETSCQELQEGASNRLDGVGVVLSKPFILKIANRSELRKFFESQVFQPGHTLPSVSLSDAADYDMAIELGLQAAQKRSMKVHKSEEEEELEKRVWDDWKDDNPKGSGNKMVNRG